VSSRHNDYERDNNTTPDLQDQDPSIFFVSDRYFLTPTVSDHITDILLLLMKN